MSWPEYKGRTVGFAKIMGELPVSDGTTAYEIMNFTATTTGFLENRFSLMPLIPEEWNNNLVGVVGQSSDPLSDTIAMQYMEWDGECPELLFFTTRGVFRFVPGNREGHFPFGSSEYGTYTSTDGYGSTSGHWNGLAEQFFYTEGGEEKSIVPQSVTMFSPQTEVVGNRVYFTFCDGGGAYVWDGSKIREFGYSTTPSQIHALGPQSNDGGEKANDGWTNGGGFSDGGRIGTLNYNITNWYEEDEILATTGGLEAGLWYYAVLYENEDGAYSTTSDKSGRVTMQFWASQVASARDKHGIQYLRRRFWLNNIPEGPPGTIGGKCL